MNVSPIFTQEEAAEIANHAVFTAFHSLEDDDEETQHLVELAVSIVAKLEKAWPGLLESEFVYCLEELDELRRKVKDSGKK